MYKASWGTALQFMDGATEIMGKQYDETHFAKVFEEEDRCRSEKQRIIDQERNKEKPLSYVQERQRRYLIEKAK